METRNIVFNNNSRIKKHMIEDHKQNKDRKRVAAEKWTFQSDDYAYETQMKTIQNILNNKYDFNDEISKISLQQINKKIYGYKQQDIIKKLLNPEKFINLESVINKMIECELKCYYCKNNAEYAFEDVLLCESCKYDETYEPELCNKLNNSPRDGVECYSAICIE